MGRGRQSFEKRQREKAKQEKQAAKRARREDRKEARAEGTDDGAVSEAELLERFRILNERHAAGEVSMEDFEEEKAELFEALGLGTE